MFKKLIKFYSMLIVAVLSFGVLTACSGSSGDNKISFSLKAQNPIVTVGEANAFIISAKNLPKEQHIDYLVAKGTSNDFVSFENSTHLSAAYTSLELGAFRVKATTTINGVKYETNIVSYNVADFGGETFGNSPIGDKATINIDYSNDYTADGHVPSIEHKSYVISNEFAYVKNVVSSRFVFSADIDIVGRNGSESYPKTGLFVKAGTDMYFFCFDPRPNFKVSDLVFVRYLPSGWSWSAANGMRTFFDAPSFRDNDGNRITNTMTIIREDQVFFIKVNQKYYKYEVKGLGDTRIGTYTMAHNTIYSNYSCYLDGSDEYTEALAAAKASNPAS